jgi:hypothetical protein
VAVSVWLEMRQIVGQKVNGFASGYNLLEFETSFA